MNVSEQILEVTTRVSILTNEIEKVGDWVKFSLTTFWASIGVVVVVLMVALVYCINARVKEGIEKGINETKSLYDNKLAALEKKYTEEIKNSTLNFMNTVNEVKEEVIMEESGRWTPCIVGDGYDYKTNEGKYFRHGSIVTLWIKIKIKRKDESSYDEAYIHGLPYAGDRIISCDITLVNSSSEHNVNNIRLFVDKDNRKSNLLTYVSLCDIYGQRMKKSWLNDDSEIIGTIVYTIKNN